MNDIEAIKAIRHPVDHAAVASAWKEISEEQMRAWAEEIATLTYPGLGWPPLYGPKRGNMLTLDGKVPWLSPAHRIAVLYGAISYIRALEGS